MLDRIRKSLIFAAITGMICLQSPSFAIDSTISYININNTAYPDIEIVIDNNNQILVPFKQLADIFEIKYEANRIDKKITFKTFDGKDGLITLEGVFINGNKISKAPTIFINQGIMEGVFNEAYISEANAAEIMGAKISGDFETLALEASVTRNIKILQEESALVNDNSPKAHQNVAVPKKNAKITLNTIGLRSNMHNDDLNVRGLNYGNSSDIFSGSSQLSLNGNVLSGKYRVEATEYHYNGDAFRFGGLTATYRNKFHVEKNNKDYYYELGKVKGVMDTDATIGTNIFGAQIWNYDTEEAPPNEISGYVKPTSLVRATINDGEPITLDTYAGYYTLKRQQLPSVITSVKLEEINEDGTVELISEKKYSAYGRNVPLQKEHRYTAYAGVWGYQNRLFREGRNIYKGNNKKVTAGAEYQYGIKDNLTFKSKLSGDKLYSKNRASLYYTVPTNDSLLVSGTSRSVNFREGATTLNSVEWQSEKNKNIKARATIGGSVMHDIRERRSNVGYSGRLTGEYSKDLRQFAKGIFKPKRLNAKVEAFDNSPDWYIASTDSTAKNDRVGGRVSGGVGFNSTSAGGSYSKYFSNINNRYKGGTIEFDEASINASTTVPKVADVRFNSYFRRGENDFGRNKNYNYEGSVNRNLGSRTRLKLGRRESVYDTKFHNPTVTDRNYYTKYADNFVRLDYRIPKNLGTAMIEHNMIKYKYEDSRRKYNMYRFGYTFPTWKRLTLGFNWGFRYHGQKGHDFGVNLGYRAKSGQQMSVGYQYSKNGGYFIDNMFTPTTNRHTVMFTFNDAFQVFHNGLRSVGDEDLTKGMFEVTAFVDVNKDGKFDKKIDIPIKNVPLITTYGGTKQYTNKRGKIYSVGLDEGIYDVKIDMDELPITVAPLTNDSILNKVKIDGGKTTKLDIPLISTVGTVSGVLSIKDDFDRNLKITDFVVVLLDENGEEVNYSTVGSDGEFYISGLAPGKYTLQLDERFISAYGLEEGANSHIDILIPYDYNTPVDIMNQNLEYKTMSL